MASNDAAIISGGTGASSSCSSKCAPSITRGAGEVCRGRMLSGAGAERVASDAPLPLSFKEGGWSVVREEGFRGRSGTAPISMSRVGAASSVVDAHAHAHDDADGGGEDGMMSPDK